MDQQIIVSCLGRSMTVGMLYDCRSDQLIPAVTLWDLENLRSNSDIHKYESSEFKIAADSNIKDKAKSLNMEAEVTLSFLGGLINVGGAAKYLENNRSSDYQARVVLQYNCKIGMESLTMNHLATKNIDHRNVFDEGMATHVVTAIEYGADAFFVFDRKESNLQSCRDVQGKMSGSLLKTGMLNANVDGYGQINDEERKFVNSFECTFYGDVALERNPTTFDDAMTIYEKIPELIRKSTNSGGIYGVPKKAHLYPLSKLDNKAAKLVCSISNNVVCETEDILNNIFYMLAVANDLENSDVCQKFSKLKQQMTRFKSLLNQFKSDFQRILCEILPRIRGGGMEESKLLEELTKIKTSPYDIFKLNTWSDARKCEFSSLKKYLEALSEFTPAFQPGELQSFTQDDNFEYVLCFSLGNMARCGNIFLDQMKEFLFSRECENVNDSMETCEETWWDDYDFIGSIQNKIREFKEFSITNADRQDIKFIVTNTSSRRGESADNCCMILYSKKGRPVVFQPPNSPGKPQMVSSVENEITISWTPSTVGVENVLFYRILYKPVSAADGSWSHVQTEGPDLQFIVKQLNPGTEYLFKVEAVSDPGKSQAGPESLPMKTKSSPRKMEELNILIFGQTGVGKSTFINALATYITYSSLEEAVSNNLITLIPTKFHHTGRDRKELTIRTGESVNEWFVKGKSATKSPRAYVLEHKDCLYRIIDTPGIGDVDGIAVDKQNMENIMKFTARYDKIHAICVLLLPNVSRLTEKFQLCFNELFVQFHRSAAENIIFCYTNTSGYMFQPQETLTQLDTLLEKINKQHHIEIKARDENRAYSFDNMAYRYCCIKNQYPDFEFAEDEENLYKTSYTISRQESDRMLNFIRTLIPHNFKKSMNIFYVRHMIECCTNPLTAIGNAIQKTITQIDEYKEQVHRCENNVDKLKTLKNEIEREQKQIYEACAKGAFFLKANALTSINDATEGYLTRLIESGKQCDTGKKVHEYEKMLDNYLKEKDIFDDHIKRLPKGVAPIRSDEMLQLLDDLKKMKHYGRNVEAAMNQALKPVRIYSRGDELETLYNSRKMIKESVRRLFEKK